MSGDLHPIRRAAAAQLLAEARVLEFHQFIDDGRGVFTSLLATQGVTHPATVRAVLDCFEGHADELMKIAHTKPNLMAGIASGFLLALALRGKGLV